MPSSVWHRWRRFSSQTQINRGEVSPRLPGPEEQSSGGSSAQLAAHPTPPLPGAAQPNKGGSGGSPLCGAGEGAIPPGAPRPAGRARRRWAGPRLRPPRPAQPGSARLGGVSGGSAGCAAGGRLPAARLLRPPSPPLRHRSSAPSSSSFSSSSRRRRWLSRPRLAAFLRGFASLLSGRLPRRAGEDGTAARSLLELQGEETCLRLETSAKGEDLLTGQAALAVAQKLYVKANPRDDAMLLERIYSAVFFRRNRYGLKALLWALAS